MYIQILVLIWTVKCLAVKLDESRLVVGTLLGFKQFMDLVLENTLEMNGNDKNYIGMVVSRKLSGGNSVVMASQKEKTLRLCD
ncbi:hypothetical protein IFM89_037081, partial [Coptis chinensis]